MSVKNNISLYIYKPQKSMNVLQFVLKLWKPFRKMLMSYNSFWIRFCLKVYNKYHFQLIPVVLTIITIPVVYRPIL